MLKNPLRSTAVLRYNPTMVRGKSSRCLRWVVLSIIVLGSGGCRRSVAVNSAHQPAPSTPASRPAVASGGAYRNDSLNIQLTYPAGWVTATDPDCVWQVVPAGGKSDTSLSLQVPTLPAHIPGMIPLRMVVNGYVDDLKKNKTQFATTQSTKTVAKVGSRLVRTTWTENGQPMFEDALILVHNDHVYILRADGKVADQKTIESAFDAVSNSLGWIK